MRPVQAIESCIKQAGISPDDIDHVAWGGEKGLTPWILLTHRYCNFSVADRIREQEQYWRPIKYARNLKAVHSRHKYFFQCGDAKIYKAKLGEIRKDFDDLKEGQTGPVEDPACRSAG